MKLSVIIPVYKVEQTLDRCIQSVLDQQIENMEVLLIDDGSPDRCPQLCDQWATKDARIRTFHQKNGGLSAARNTGLDHATGDYITFVDSDDYVHQNTYRPCLYALAKHPEIDILEYPIQMHAGTTEEYRLSFGTNLISCQSLPEKQQCWCKHSLAFHCFMCNKIFRHGLFRETRFPVGHIYEDRWILPQLVLQAECYATIDEGLYYYVENTQGICHQYLATGEEEAIKAGLHALDTLQIDPHDRLADQDWFYLVNHELVRWAYSNKRPEGCLLPQRHLPLHVAWSLGSRLKLMAINTLGLPLVCRLYRLVHTPKRKNAGL